MVKGVMGGLNPSSENHHRAKSRVGVKSPAIASVFRFKEAGFCHASARISNHPE